VQPAGACAAGHPGGEIPCPSFYLVCYALLHKYSCVLIYMKIDFLYGGLMFNLLPSFAVISLVAISLVHSCKIW
jgi:hypothetical protein